MSCVSDTYNFSLAFLLILFFFFFLKMARKDNAVPRSRPERRPIIYRCTLSQRARGNYKARAMIHVSDRSLRATRVTISLDDPILPLHGMRVANPGWVILCSLQTWPAPLVPFGALHGMREAKPGEFWALHGVRVAKPGEFRALHGVRVVKPDEFRALHGVQVVKPGEFGALHGVRVVKPGEFGALHGV